MNRGIMEAQWLLLKSQKIAVLNLNLARGAPRTQCAILATILANSCTYASIAMHLFMHPVCEQI